MKNLFKHWFPSNAEQDQDNLQNPWAGLASYEDPATAKQKLKFCGRDDDSYDVAKLIMGNIFVTLYGKSGIGKTSLLNAGVFPELREEQYTPISLRLGIRDDKHPQSFQTIILESIKHNVHHIDTKDIIPTQDNQQSPDFLWKYFANHCFYDKNGNPTTPVIVFDQFEEVFRSDRKEVETLLRQLDQCVVNGQSHRFETDARFVVSIREDDLYRLEDSIDNCYLSALKRCRYRLRSLSEGGAREVILVPGKGLFLPTEEELIIQKIIQISQNKDDLSISTNLLSLVCNRIYVSFQRYKDEKYIGVALVDSFIKDNPFELFYNEATKNLSIREKSYIEEHLVDSIGRRNSIPESDFILHVKNGAELLEGRNRILQRISTSSDGKNYRIELIHDSFCEPLIILQKKREQRRKIIWISVGMAIVLGCIILTSIYINLIRMNARKDITIVSAQQSADSISLLNANLNKHLLINKMQRDSLDSQLKINKIQRDSISNLLLEQQLLSKSLGIKNQELEQSLDRIIEQKTLIQQKDSIISKYGICYACNGAGLDHIGNVCSTCLGTGHITSNEVVRNNSVIQLRRIRPKER